MTELTRRAAVAGGAAAIGLAASGGFAANRPFDPRGSADGQIKMEACLDGHPAVWSYSGLIYAVTPRKRPLAILKIAGGSTSWAAKLTNGDWQLKGATMSFFCDPVSGAFLDEYANPLNGKRQRVLPNILSGGGMIFPADGSAPRFQGKSRAGESAPGGFDEANPNRPLGRVEWGESGALVTLLTDHAFEVPVQPQLEARTIFADRKAFFDSRVTRLPAHFTTTTITPWLGWMDMADDPGHLVWHCSGEKLFDADAMPLPYRTRAGGLMKTLVERPTD